MHEGQEKFEQEDEDDPDADCPFFMRVYRYTEIIDIYFRFDLHLLYILVDCVPHT